MVPIGIEKRGRSSRSNEEDSRASYRINRAERQPMKTLGNVDINIAGYFVCEISKSRVEDQLTMKMLHVKMLGKFVATFCERTACALWNTF